MKITLEGETKEIADLIAQIQGQLSEEASNHQACESIRDTIQGFQGKFSD